MKLEGELVKQEAGEGGTVRNPPQAILIHRHGAILSESVHGGEKRRHDFIQLPEPAFQEERDAETKRRIVVRFKLRY